MSISHGKKLFLEIAGTIIAGFILLFIFLLWRLNQGPFKADFLKPIIESTLTRKSGLDIHLGSVVLEWNGAHKPFDVDATSITADGEGQRREAIIDDLKLQLSASSLLKGKFRPLSLTLVHPQLWIEPKTQTAKSSSPIDLAPVLSPPKGGSFALWNNVSLTDAEITFRNMQHQDISRIDVNSFTAMRALDGEVDAELTGNSNIGDTAAPLSVATQYNPQDGLLSISAHCDRIGLNSLAALSPALAELKALQIPLALQLEVKTDVHLAVQSAHLESQILAGQIVDANLFDAPAPISGGHLDITYRAAPERVDLNDFTLNLDGATITTSGAASTLNNEINFDVSTNFANIPIDALSTYWPKTLSKGGRLWVTANLSKGTITEGKTHLSGTAPRNDPGNIAFDTIEGGFHVDNALVHYFGELPSVETVAGDVKFDDKTMTITLRKGTLLT